MSQKGVTAAHAAGISADDAELDKRPLKSGLKTIDDFMLDNFVRTCAGCVRVAYMYRALCEQPTHIRAVTLTA